MAQRSKMENGIAELESSSSPSTYQCIVCQMRTMSLSVLHRHQTYQHTPEELSLSTLRLQCPLINNVHAAHSIIYDNSCLCDPLKQAKFYTVSASLLKDCNNSNDPVNYVVKKDDRNFKDEDNSDIALEQEILDFNSIIDHNYGRVANFPVGSSENGMQMESFTSIGTETNCAEFLEKLHQPETSLALCTETERLITYLEEVMHVEEIITMGAEADYHSKSLGKIIEAEEYKAVDAVPSHGFDSPKNVMQAEDPKYIHGKTASTDVKVAESKIIGPEGNCVLKSAETEPEVEEFKLPDAHSILKFSGKETNVQVFKDPEAHSISKSAEKETKVQEFKVPEARSISKSAEKETNVQEFKVPEAHSISKSAEKETNVKGFKVPRVHSISKSAGKKIEVHKFKVPEANTILKSVLKAAKETESEELKVVGPKACGSTFAEKGIKDEEPKDIDRERNVISKSAEKAADVEEVKVIGSEANHIIATAKKVTTNGSDRKLRRNVEKPEADAFANCVEGLCIDLEKIKNKPQKRKRAPPRNPTPRKAKAAAKPRAPRKKAVTSDSVTDNITVKQAADQQTEISAKNNSASMDCEELNLKTEKTKDSVEPPRKKARISHSLPANITIRQEVDREPKIPVKNHSASTDCAEVNLDIHKTENSLEPPRKKAKTSNTVAENTKITQDGDLKNEIPAQNYSASIKHIELSSKSQKTENSVDVLPRKEAKTSNSVPKNTTIIQKAKQETEISSQNDSPSVNHTELNVQRTGNSVKKIFSEEDVVEAQLRALFQQQTETQETEISVIDNSAKSHWIDYHVERLEHTIPDEEDLTRDNFIQQYVDTCKAEIPAEIPVEVNSEELEFLGDEVDDPRNSENSGDSVIADLPSTYTFPGYPPDINDYSILVLDPEAHQLVWTEVAIVNDKNKLQNENSRETVVLPELTEADLRESDICENMTISSGSQTKESSRNVLRSQTERNTPKTKKKPHTNFGLRPRKAAGRKSL